MPSILKLFEEAFNFKLVVSCRLCSGLLHFLYYLVSVGHLEVGFVCHGFHLSLVVSGTVMDFGQGLHRLEVFSLMELGLGFGLS